MPLIHLQMFPTWILLHGTALVMIGLAVTVLGMAPWSIGAVLLYLVVRAWMSAAWHVDTRGALRALGLNRRETLRKTLGDN